MNTVRRRLLGCACLAGLSAIAGCGKGDGPAGAVPKEIDAATACELDGMTLADYPGPKAQVHYAGQAEPSFFCDTVEMFATLLRPEQVKAVRAAYVQDMGKADWERPRGHWIDAKAGHYVVGSKRHGSMGPTIASFADPGAAAGFAQQHGGRVLAYAQVTPAMVDLGGGAQHDTKM